LGERTFERSQELVLRLLRLETLMVDSRPKHDDAVSAPRRNRRKCTVCEIPDDVIELVNVHGYVRCRCRLRSTETRTVRPGIGADKNEVGYGGAGRKSCSIMKYSKPFPWGRTPKIVLSHSLGDRPGEF